MIGIVVSEADEASVHVGEQLRAAADWAAADDPSVPPAAGGGTVYRTDGFELRTFEERHLDVEDAADPFADPDLLVFVSRHAGDTGPLLTAHFTGNLGPAEYGGADGELATACPGALRAAIRALDDRAPEGYDVAMECTHHGPSRVGAPSMFVEVGSAEPQWRDGDAARAVAEAVLSLRGVAPGSDRTVVAFGGGHYAPRPTRVLRETDWAVGHVAADWALDAMGDPDPAVVAQVFERSGADRALLTGERPDLRAAVADLGYEFVSETFLHETTGVPLSLVESLTAALCSVDDGLRFGAATDAEAFDVLRADELLAEANGVDGAATRAAVARTAAAFETTNGGSRAAGRVAVPAGTAGSLVDALAEVLREKYDTVRVADGVVARRETFDPAAARAAGVSEGPAFGRLADGEAVTVDGERVTPDAVHETEERRFPPPERLTEVGREGER